MIEGAKYEAPTPAKLGKSPAADKARKRVASLERRFTQAMAKADADAKKTRPRTKTGAEQFIAETDADYEKMLQAMSADEVKPKGVVAKRNARNAKLARRGRPTKAPLSAEAHTYARRSSAAADSSSCSPRRTSSKRARRSSTRRRRFSAPRKS